MSLKHILESECKQNNNTILLTSGLDGANIINDVYRQSCPNIFIVNTTHLIFDEHNQILGKANLIALPTSSIDSNFLQAAEQKGSKIIQTIGVAHNSTPAILEQDYQKHQKDFEWLTQKSKIAMIILGGDAPAKDNKIAVRYIKHKFLSQIIKKIGPVASTSLNIHKHIDQHDFNIPCFGDLTKINACSSIYDSTNNSIIREGQISATEIYKDLER